LKNYEGTSKKPRTLLKKTNLQIMGIEEEKVQVKRLKNIFNKIIGENFQNPKKGTANQGQEAFRMLKRQDIPTHVVHKTLRIQKKERVIKSYKREATSYIQR
jgi:hypothetical protein